MITGNLLVFIICIHVLCSDGTNFVNCRKQKRQLFREQLLPEKGGKIPDSAFNPDRLLLNRLNQQGISIPDGVYPDQRRQEKHPIPKEELQDTLKVTLTDEGRYIAPPGRYNYEKSPTVDTTYIIRMPVHILEKGSSTTQPPRYNAAQSIQNHKEVDLGNWVPPLWYNGQNDISNNKNKDNDDLDPSQILAEYSSYLQKIHNYDK